MQSLKIQRKVRRASTARGWPTSILARPDQLVATRCQGEWWSVPDSVVDEQLMKQSFNTDWAERLTGQIHDMWFSVDDLRIDEARQELVIPLRPKPKSTAQKVLVVPNARAIRVTDSEHIGLYDINYVKVLWPERVLSIRGNIPIRVDIEADDPCDAHVEPYAGMAIQGGDQA